MKISARNVFDGTVARIKPGAVNSEIDVTLAGGLTLVSTITNDSVQALALTPGKAVKGLVKASSVLVLVDGDNIRLSTRNRLEGTIAALIDGPVSTEVKIALANGQQVCASITHESASEMALKVGQQAAAVFKASSVVIGVSV